ncbi:MAG: CinA family protein [Candidatus Limnocylindria bacterium]
MPADMPPTDADLVAAARRLGEVLVARGWQMAAAESCTGGLVGHAITAVPRASDHFLGGIVSYSNAAKEDLLAIGHDMLEQAGAVSPDVAKAMAAGALTAFPAARLAVAVTGIAGPDGGSAQKPVGLTYMAAAVRDGEALVEEARWPFDRDGNKRASALATLELATRAAST